MQHTLTVGVASATGRSARDFGAAIGASGGDQEVVLLVCKGDSQRYLVLRRR